MCSLWPAAFSYLCVRVRILGVLKIVCGWANKTWLLPYACCGLHFTDSAACVLSFYHSTPLHLKTLDFYCSGTFPQTLPELVTPLKGHSILYLCAGVHRRCQRLPKGLGTTNKTVKATQLPSTHVNMRRVRPGHTVSSVSIKTILVLFVTAKAMWDFIKETPDIIQSKLFVTNLLLFEHQRKSVCHPETYG